MEPACSYKVMVRGITFQNVSMYTSLHSVTSQNVSVSTRLHDITSQKGTSLYPTARSHSQRQSQYTRTHGVTSHNW